MLYRDAGVDITAMDAVKRRIAGIARSTFSPGVISEVGLFGSLCRVPKLRDPVLVASCDGVGTKLVIARLCGRYDTVGIDIVNHSVNDILTLGARPLFFLDYIAHSKLKPESLLAIVQGLGKACRDNGCSLVGGETAMMPDIYRPHDFDLAGFIVGTVERNKVIDATRISPGDAVIGIPSSGLHTNGYSLARRVLFDKAGLKVSSRIKGLTRSLGEELLRPHRSYLKPVYSLLSRIHALAHITGGGFYGNIARLLPHEVSVIVKKSGWRPSPIFGVIQRLGNVPDEEMYRTFNMGMGMVLFVAPKQTDRILGSIPGSRVIGKVVRGTFGVSVV
ncbi:MAG: phosphoribosylformylglycinamidine cyclo-ligase [candidate division WOR-3 bacterium]|nr:phosphoribosylformylglycinamidine cyclo-ligase [candidate division WOR-3 bacterium]